MPLEVADLIERDGPTCVWCSRELWQRDLTLEHVVARSPRRAHREVAARQLRRLRAVTTQT